MTQSYAILTAVGRNKEAAALAAGTPLTISEIALGDGTRLPAGAETALENEVHRGAITAAGVLDPEANTAYFELYLPIEVGGFVIHEAGLFDDAGDMIAIARYNDPIPKFDPASGASNDLAIRMHIIFSDVQNLAFAVNPVIAVTTNNIATAIPWATDEEAQDPTVTGKAIDPKRLHAGLPWATEQDAEDETKEFKIIDPKRLWHVLKGFFVPSIKLNTTYKIGSHVDDDFPTLTAALAEIILKVIMPWVTVTLEMRDEVHTYNADVIFDHPQSRQIQIKASSVPAAKPTKAGFQLGATSPGFYSSRLADNAANKAYTQGLYACQIVFTSGGLVFETGLKLLKDVWIDGNTTHSPIWNKSEEIRLKNVTIVEGLTQISNSHGHITCDDVFLIGSDASALSMSGGHFEINAGEFLILGATTSGLSLAWNSQFVSSISADMWIYGCGGDGAQLSWNSSAHMEAVNIWGCGGSGVHVAATSSVYCPASVLIHNYQAGIAVFNQGFADCNTSNITSNYRANGYTDIYAARGAHIYSSPHNGTVYYSPAFGSIGNQNSMIS